jgi:hypothetical protein
MLLHKLHLTRMWPRGSSSRIALITACHTACCISLRCCTPIVVKAAQRSQHVRIMIIWVTHVVGVGSSRATLSWLSLIRIQNAPSASVLVTHQHYRRDTAPVRRQWRRTSRTIWGLAQSIGHRSDPSVSRIRCLDHTPAIPLSLSGRYGFRLRS